MTRQNREIMTRKLVTIAHDRKISEAYLVMSDRAIRHLPVTDSTGAIVGLLSERDLQRAMIPTEGGTLTETSKKFDPRHDVSQFMSWPVKSIADSSSIRETAEKMIREKISALLITRDGDRPVGIITTDDLLKLLVTLLEKDPPRLALTLGAWMSELTHGENVLV